MPDRMSASMAERVRKATQPLRRRARHVGLATACLVCLVPLAAPSSSVAAAPILAITNPHNDQVIRTATLTFKGTTTIEPPAERAPITIAIHRGRNLGGAVVDSVTTEPEPGTTEWSVKTELEKGEYTAIAEQSEAGEGTLIGKSNPVTFTIDTTPTPPPPKVHITYPAPASSAVGEAQLFTGSAETVSGDGNVTVEIFAGSAVAQPALRSATVPAGANWSVTIGGLAPGTYTAQASQAGAGGIGRSEPVTFTLTPRTPGPAAPPPTAAFTWFPDVPAVGQSVVLVSDSTDAFSPISAFAWDLLGGGPFKPGGALLTTSFSTAGRHVVRLQVTGQSGGSSIASETIPVSAQPLKPMQPFPIVRIAGVKTSSGVRLSSLNVQLPVGARVTVACKGRGCKMRPQSRIATASAHARNASSVVLAFRAFERSFVAGVSLQVRVFSQGEIGKYTSFSIHRHGLPTREDLCLSALEPQPIPCPA
jgi:hypothetical protein